MRPVVFLYLFKISEVFSNNGIILMLWVFFVVSNSLCWLIALLIVMVFFSKSMSSAVSANTSPLRSPWYKQIRNTSSCFAFKISTSSASSSFENASPFFLMCFGFVSYIKRLIFQHIKNCLTAVNLIN